MQHTEWFLQTEEGNIDRRLVERRHTFDQVLRVCLQEGFAAAYTLFIHPFKVLITSLKERTEKNNISSPKCTFSPLL